MDLIPSLRGAGVVNDHPAAVTIAGRSLSLGALSAAAGAVAARLVGLTAVAVEATPSLETVVAVLGGLMAGVPVVPVAPDAGPLERSHILRSCAAPVLLAAPGTEPMVSDLNVQVVEVRVDAGVRPVSSQTVRVPTTSPASPAVILFTSGTTGPPKGVMLSTAALAADLDALAVAWAWTPDDVLVHGLPLFHVHGLVLGVLGALRVGSPLVHTGRATPGAYAAAAEDGGSLFFGVPTVWSRVAADQRAAAALRRARLLISGSAGLPGPVFEQLAVLAGQGPVERLRNDRDAHHPERSRGSSARRAGWVGQPLPGIDVTARW